MLTIGAHLYHMLSDFTGHGVNFDTATNKQKIFTLNFFQHSYERKWFVMLSNTLLFSQKSLDKFGNYKYFLLYINLFKDDTK